MACLLGVDGADDPRVRDAGRLADLGELDLGGLVVLWRDGQAVAATISSVSQDGSAFVWPAEIASGGDPRDAVRLLGEVLARARETGCRYAQSALETDRHDQRLALEAVGFEFLTELVGLERSLKTASPRPYALPGKRIFFEESLTGRFCDVIERTYGGSRDCAGFAGMRSAAEAIESYRFAGVFAPRHWELVVVGGQDVAVMLVNFRPEEAAREIVYLGVVPEARRRGLGDALVAMALNDAAAAGDRSVLTSVDATNLPAVNLYSRAGFAPASRRAVYLWRHESPGRSGHASV